MSGDYSVKRQLRSVPGRASAACGLAAVLLLFANAAFPAGFSMFFEGGAGAQSQAVRIPYSGSTAFLNFGGSFTIDFWIKALPGENAGLLGSGPDAWRAGNIVIDRDSGSAGENPRFGVSLTGGRLSFGVARGTSGSTITGARRVDDGAWHHVALTRDEASGAVRVFVDGQPDGSGSGPTGTIAYSAPNPIPFPLSDPFLFIGGPKSEVPPSPRLGFRGWIDDIRIANGVRYPAGFTPPALPGRVDTTTLALIDFDEGGGRSVALLGGGPAEALGAIKVAAPSANAAWVADTPFALAAPALALEPLVGGLSSPVEMVPDGRGGLLIVEQSGRVKVFRSGVVLAEPFLDLSAAVVFGGEQGLLGLALEPNYAQTGRFYVNYTRAGDGATVIARYARSAANPDRADPASAQVLLTLAQPFANHNGGKLAFGPDGFLYVGLGDGGSGNDPSNFAQNNASLLGKMLRIDVAGSAGYAIPPTNPLLGVSGARPEIWATGLRNPWRFSFDRLTGDLFIGDVGQGAREEVNFQSVTSGGGENYGWRVMEGSLCTNLGGGPACNDPALTLPILEYDHTQGCAVTGGFRYRGSRIDPLRANYLYADFCNGRISGAARSGAAWASQPLLESGVLVSAFGEGPDGELMVADYGAGTLHRLVARDGDADGMPDWWEQRFFGTETGGPAATDSDGDGFSNLQEYLAHTSPTDPGDFPRTQLYSAVLPGSRSAVVGSPVTVFGAVANTSATTATGCGVALDSSAPAQLAYQATDPATNAATGTPNTPLDIPAGQVRTFVVGLTPTREFAPTDMALDFRCASHGSALVMPGVNSVLLAASATPRPDVVAVVATTSGDGIVAMPGAGGAAAFAVATTNVGSADTITVAADAGGVSLPLEISVCETVTSTGACKSPPAPQAATTAGPNETRSFGVFVRATGAIPLRPAVNRVHVRFRDSAGLVRGITSVAVTSER